MNRDNRTTSDRDQVPMRSRSHYSRPEQARENQRRYPQPVQGHTTQAKRPQAGQARRSQPQRLPPAQRPTAQKQGSRPVKASIQRSRRRRYTRRRIRIEWKRFLPFMGLLIVMAVSAVYLIGYISSSVRVHRTEAELQAMYGQEDSSAPGTQSVAETPTPAPTPAPTGTPAPTPTPVPQILSEYQVMGTSVLPDLQKLYGKNNEMVGYIKIPGGVVDAPVVYRNNSYYLNRDFYQRKSSAGALFLDENSPLAADTQNLLIYGHNMHDGTMFGHFGRYRRESYWQDNCFVRFSTLYSEDYYVIFAVLNVSTDPASPNYVNFAGHPTFGSVREFEAYMEDLKAHTLHPWRIDVNASDALLTLATCLDDERVVLIARRVREGETMEGLIRQITGY